MAAHHTLQALQRQCEPAPRGNMTDGCTTDPASLAAAVRASAARVIDHEKVQELYLLVGFVCLLGALEVSVLACSAEPAL